MDGRELRGFSFLYGMIPTSSAPLLFAMRYSPASAELLASSILLGLVAAGPLMFAAALFLEHDEDTDCPRLAEIGRDWTRLDGTSRGCWPVRLLEHDKDTATVD